VIDEFVLTVLAVSRVGDNFPSPSKQAFSTMAMNDFSLTLTQNNTSSLLITANVFGDPWPPSSGININSL
jgi:hypothetical protein